MHLFYTQAFECFLGVLISFFCRFLIPFDSLGAILRQPISVLVINSEIAHGHFISQIGCLLIQFIGFFLGFLQSSFFIIIVRIFFILFGYYFLYFILNALSAIPIIFSIMSATVCPSISSLSHFQIAMLYLSVV